MSVFLQMLVLTTHLNNLVMDHINSLQTFKNLQNLVTAIKLLFKKKRKTLAYFTAKF